MNVRRPGWIRPITLLLGAGFVLALPVPARASSLSFQFNGGGWGHGTGLSQWGAYGQASSGRSFSQILTHYYQGSSVAESGWMPPEVRVGVLWNRSEIQITGNGTFEIRHGSLSGELIATGGSDQLWRVISGSNGNFVVLGPAGQNITLEGNTKALYVTFAHHGTLLRLPQSGNRYKYGALEINTYFSGSWLTRAIVGGLGMQQYLYGLAEMPSSWPIEALKAQATAGRTYATEKIARLGQSRPVCNCGLFASTLDQVYSGYEKEAAASGDRWVSAVNQTNAQAVFSGGSLIEAYYFSSSGGHTEHNEYVWPGGSPRSYLRGVPDPWDSASPNHSWTVTYGIEDLQKRLNAFADTAPGILYSIEPLSPFGVSGRVLQVIDGERGGVRIVGSSGVKRVSGDRIRSVLGLRSTLFRVHRVGVHPDGTLLKGSGPAVFLIEGGSLRTVPSPGVLLSRGGWSDVIGVPDSWLLQYDTGKRGFRDGTLIRTPNGTVWIVSGGLRRGFVSAEVFTGLGYSWSNVRDISWGEAQLHAEGPPILSTTAHPDGTLIKGSGPGVWWLQAGTKRPIPSLAVFDSWFRWAEVVGASDSKIDSYPDGPTLGFRDGFLIRTPNGTVWVISNAQRRGFGSAQVFGGLGYSWSNVRDVDYWEAGLHPEGDGIHSVGGGHPSGTVARGSLPFRFHLENGVRYLITTDHVFDSWNLRPSEVLRASDAQLASWGTSKSPVNFRDGTLIRTPNGTVWIVSGGLRRGFVSAEVFTGLGYSWSNVRDISWGEAQLHAEGPPILSTTAHPDGTLIKGSGPGVWWLQAGTKRPIPSLAVFDSWFRWAEVVGASDSKIDSYPDGPTLGFRDGFLIRTPNGTVWVISNAQRRGFGSAEVFGGLGYSWSNVRAVDYWEAGIHPEGEPIR